MAGSTPKPQSSQSIALCRHTTRPIPALSQKHHNYPCLLQIIHKKLVVEQASQGK